MKDSPKLTSTSAFATEIESMVKSQGMELIDAVITWCTKNNVDVEQAAAMIKKDSVLKGKIQAEAEAVNMVKGKTARLPI